MKRQLLAILTTLLLWALPLAAQVDTVFWMAMPRLALHSRDMSLHLYVFSDAPSTRLRVEMPANPSFSVYNAELDSGQCADIVLANNYTEYMRTLAVPYGQVSNRGLLLTTSHPVTCYYQLTGVNGEAVVPRGSIALGTDFCLAMQNRYRNSNIPGQIYKDAYTSLEVVATEDSTLVEIISPVPYGEQAATEGVYVMLHRGQTYALRAFSKQQHFHLTDTRIRATRPICVMSSDDSASPHQKVYGEDAVLDQMLPTDYYGNDFIAVGRGLSWEGCFLTAGEETANVSITGADSTLVLQPGETRFVPLGKQWKVMRIASDNPIQVFQLSGYRNELGGVLLPDIARSGSQIVRYRRMTDSRHTSMNIIISTADTAMLRLDGAPLHAAFVPLSDDTTWSYTIADVTDRPIGQVLTLTAPTRFHVGIVDATGAPTTQAGVITSASYSYFSNYRWPEEPEIPEVPEILEIPEEPEVVDTVIIVEVPVVEEEKQEKTDTVHHRLLIYGEGGYSHNPLYVSGVHFGLGYGVGAGLLYEVRHRHFLFDIGAGFLWQDTEHRLEDNYLSVPNIDTQDAEHTLYYLLRRTDRSRLGYVEVPVLMGGEWDAFYFLVGAKVGVPVLGNTRMQNRVSSWAMYDEYFVPFSQMDVHGLRLDVPCVQTAERLAYKVDTRLSAEVGVDLGPLMRDTVPSSVSCRLAAFADYGFYWPTGSQLSEHGLAFDGYTAPVTDMSGSTYDFRSWPMTHVLNSTIANGQMVHNFLVGLKLTVIFSFSRNRGQKSPEL